MLPYYFICISKAEVTNPKQDQLKANSLSSLVEGDELLDQPNIKHVWNEAMHVPA